MKRLQLWHLRGLAASLLAGCSACTPPLPGPVQTDAAQVDGGCQTLDNVTTSRLIRTADGSPLVIHCDAGSP